ncbi:peptidase M15 [Vibrio sp. 10N.286.49.C2]|uniref:M15 family metallopeptidase n=1 Tax=unclassified Vibrio TaxID=2614977 RepID=UPI000C822AE6|nr:MULTISPECIES: M15 family metallopeptidase [unclassified Vibrio]PMH36807.1 peptidase M15 [Vibrio sp. 10N.286.49.C2]PMH46970.1 peptidase M15 [Vibrio sp. 10N.286.49.B1]PMH82632.1 peptidase M15 [Vibrio sp. 10N.286.48.B7]
MTNLSLVGQDETVLTELQIGQRFFQVHPNVQEDLNGLTQAASDAGFVLYIASGYRSFERQLTIWNNKMTGKQPILDSHGIPLISEQLTEKEKVYAILKWSALPGASRHHWGTDFDVYAGNSLPENTPLKLEPWEYIDGHQSAFYQWLKAHLPASGFFLPYQQDLVNGVAFEPWHISHQKASQSMLAALSLEQLHRAIEQSAILGRNTILSELNNIYNQYILNISK